MSRHLRPAKGIHPAPAAVAAFGFSLPIWSVLNDQRSLIYLRIFIGCSALYFADNSLWNQTPLKGTIIAILFMLTGFAAVPMALTP